MTISVISGTIVTTGVTLAPVLRGSTLTVTNTGGIITAAGPALSGYGTNGTLNVSAFNYGTIAAGTGYAVQLTGTAQIYNYGYIGGGTGIGPGGSNSQRILANAGTIAGNGTSAGAGYGIMLGGRDTLYNLGTIYGVHSGVTASAGAPFYGIQNRGVIAGGTNAAVLDHDSLLNSGTLTGGTAGVSMSGALVTNTGSIDGGETGINAGGGYILNEGTITGGAAGIHAVTAAIGNRGFIGGTIGIQAAGGTITNAGTISGSSYAVFGSMLDITVQAGASFQGMVDDSAGTGTLALGGSSAGSLDISSFTGFDTIQFATTGWMLEGGTAELAMGESIQGFQPGDTLILNGFSASTGSYTPGSGIVVLSNASASETLHLSGLSGTRELAFNSGADGTTLAASNTLYNSVVIHYPALGLSLAAGYDLVDAGEIFGYGVRSSYEGIHFVQYVRGHAQGVVATNATIINSGLISGVDDGVYLASGGKLINAGTIFANGYYYYAHASHPDLPPVPPVIIQGPAYAVFNKSGSFTLTADPGAVFAGQVKDDPGNGLLTLGSGSSAGSLDISSFTGFDTIEIAAGSTWTLEGGTTQLAAGESIGGFAAGDTIFLDGFSPTSSRYIAGTGLVLSNATANETLDIAAPPFGFSVAAKNGNTEITAACFCRGTRIATPRGAKPVETLAIGDVVKTDLGPATIKWIGMRAYDGAFIAGNHLALPIKIRRHALSFNVPSRDVYLSPDHGVCEGGVFIPAWRLVNGVSITQLETIEQVEYFHIELENPAVIFAENMAVESFVDADCRQRFQNAAEFAALYPNTPPAQKPCRPRVEDGFLLQRIQNRINARAGLASATETTSTLRGNIDTTSPRLTGWAQDAAAPETPVTLEILHNGIIIGLLLANRYRPDLRQAGLGSGCHAFDVPLPALPGTITLRRPADGATIGGTAAMPRLKKARGSAP
jgi:hypothetical protein